MEKETSKTNSLKSIFRRIKITLSYNGHTRKFTLAGNKNQNFHKLLETYLAGFKIPIDHLNLSYLDSKKTIEEICYLYSWITIQGVFKVCIYTEGEDFSQQIFISDEDRVQELSRYPVLKKYKYELEGKKLPQNTMLRSFMSYKGINQIHRYRPPRRHAKKFWVQN